MGLGFRRMEGSHAPNACHLDNKNGIFRVWFNEHAGTFGKEKYTSICKKANAEDEGIRDYKQKYLLLVYKYLIHNT